MPSTCSNSGLQAGPQERAVHMLNVHTLDLQKAEFAQVMNDAKQTCIWGVAQCARFAYSTSSQADMAQLVEHNLAKVGVAGSSPVVRSIVCKEPVDQSALFISAAWPSGKAEACKAFTPGSNPGAASITLRKGRPAGCLFCYSSAFHRPGVFHHLNAFATNYAYPHGTIRSALQPKPSACLQAGC